MTHEQEWEVLRNLTVVSRACREATEAFAKIERAIVCAMDVCLGTTKEEVEVPVETSDDF
jgi:hypothetical protein